MVIQEFALLSDKISLDTLQLQAVEWRGGGEGAGNTFCHFSTHTTFSELLGINGRCEVQSPSVICHWIFPVNETF
jgi:hypothetical protein